MADLSQKYASLKADRTDFLLDKDHLKALHALKKRHEIIVTRPNKCDGVVILACSDNLEKMDLILPETKFKRQGDVESNNHTHKQGELYRDFF